MDINFGTDKLIIMKYPPGAGGKFISLALNVHPDVLPQDEKLAKKKIEEGFKNLKLGFKISMKTFEIKRQKKKHIEYGCKELAGFNGLFLTRQGIDIDEKIANNFWRELTNQSKYYFFMIDHTDLNLYRRYINKKVIVLKNFDWILKGRPYFKNKINIEKVKFPTTTETDFCFDMLSLQDQTFFKNELDKVLEFLNLKKFNLEMSNDIEILRKNFLETYKIGFKNE